MRGLYIYILDLSFLKRLKRYSIRLGLGPRQPGRPRLILVFGFWQGKAERKASLYHTDDLGHGW